MKKKIIITLIAVSMLTGCGKKENSTTTATTESITTETTTEETTEAAKEKSLDDIAAYLVDGGYVTGEQTETMYSYIGAIGGFKYLDSNVEVYEYDTSSDIYAEIVNSNSVSGLKVSAINEQFVLIFSGGQENQEIIDAFNAY